MSFISVVSVLSMYRLAMSDIAYVLIGLGCPGVAWMAELRTCRANCCRNHQRIQSVRIERELQ